MLNYKLEVLFKDKKIKSNLKELVQYDYNSMILKFSFDVTESRYLFKLKGPDNTTIMVEEIDNNQLILGKGALNKVGYYTYEISAYGLDSKLTNYAKGSFYVRDILIDTDEVLEPEDDRPDIVDQLINDVNTLESTININETARQSNEQTRISNEATREENEITRQNNETAREKYITDLKKDVADGKFDGEDGYTPVKGVDYYTDAERNELKDEIVNDANSDFNRNVTEKTETFNTNATNKTTNFNSNAQSKLDDYNSNHTTQKNAYDQNATDKITAFNNNATNKTTDYNTNHTEKLEAYNDNAASKTNDFNDNAESYGKRLDRAELVYNALPKVSGEGTSITIDDTAKCPMPMSLAPSELEQATTTGKNLFDKATMVQNGYISSGNLISINSTTKNIIIPCETNKTYTISKVASARFRVGYITISYANGVSVNGVITNHTSTSITITTGENAQYLVAYIYDVTIDTLTLESILDSIQVELGDTATSYEPFTYGASPNPDYPQDIHTISGDNEIKVGYHILSYKADAYLNNSGQEIDFTNTNYTTSFIEILSQTQYVFNGALCNDAGAYVGIYYFDENKNFISRDVANHRDEQITLTFTTPQNCKYIDFQYRTTGNNINDWTLRKNISTIDMIIFNSKSYPLTLGDLKYCKIGNYEDEFVKPNGKNLFDASSFENQLVSGKILNDNGVEVNDSTSEYSTYKIAVKANKVINIKGWFQKIYLFDTSNNLISRSASYDGATTVTQPSFNYMPPIDGYIAFQIYKQHYNSNKGREQIEYGTSATDYEPYNDGKWYLKKNIGKIILNGSENDWETRSTTTDYSYFVSNILRNIATTGSGSYCNNFTKGTLNSSSDATDNKFSISGGNLGTRFSILTSLLLENTVDGWKSWLNSNNTAVYYCLATPEYILLNNTLQEQLDNIYNWAISYQDQTNISQVNDDLPFNVKARACKDINAIISNLTNAIIEVGGEVE